MLLRFDVFLCTADTCSLQTMIHFWPGYEFSPNCGRHDDGGRSEAPYRPCAAQSFNNGSFVKCHPCLRCAPNNLKLSECNTTTDTQCCVARWAQIFSEIASNLDRKRKDGRLFSIWCWNYGCLVVWVKCLTVNPMSRDQTRCWKGALSTTVSFTYDDEADDAI